MRLRLTPWVLSITAVSLLAGCNSLSSAYTDNGAHPFAASQKAKVTAWAIQGGPGLANVKVTMEYASNGQTQVDVVGYTDGKGLIDLPKDRDALYTFSAAGYQPRAIVWLHSL